MEGCFPCPGIALETSWSASRSITESIKKEMSIYGRENISDLLFDSYKPGMLISTDVLKIVHEKLRNIQYLTRVSFRGVFLETLGDADNTYFAQGYSTQYLFILQRTGGLGDGCPSRGLVFNF